MVDQIPDGFERWYCPPEDNMDAHRGNRTNWELIARMEALRAQGWSCIRIGAELGVTPGAVWWSLKRADWARRAERSRR